MTSIDDVDGSPTRRQAMAMLIQSFRDAGVDDPALDARILLCAAADIDHAALIRDPDAPIDEDGWGKLREFARRRRAREPVTRILGTRGFWSLDIEVAPGVLDPRPDSEALIDAALRVMADRQNDALRIADFGCGSGALLCALLDVFENATGVGVDVSPQACRLTRANLSRCGFGARTLTINEDWSRLAPDRFDLIVCNPPYIPSGDIAGLDPEVRDHDPRLALDGGPDGLDAHRSFWAIASRALNPRGVAIAEVGVNQAEAVSELVIANGLTLLGVQRDLAGIQRAVMAQNVTFGV